MTSGCSGPMTMAARSSGRCAFFRAGGKEKGANVLPMAVFSDGTLLASFHDFPLGADRSSPGPRRSGVFTVLSSDGGVTFTEPRAGPDEVYPAYSDPNIRLAGDASIAVDASDQHRDRVYRVWQDARFAGGKYRIIISTSDDRGATWAEPRLVDAGAPAESQQFLASVSVNKNGVVGVSWHDTRNTGPDRGSNVYFSASVDGGTTFLPPQRVSSETSRPLGGGNLVVTPTFFTVPDDSGATRLSFLSAAARWGNGGDYAAMAADADGVFHPVWADARSGIFQVWTARVRVESGVATTVAAGGTPTDVTASITFVPDPSRFDAATGELTIVVRLKNTGDRELQGPMSVSVRKFGSGMGAELREFAPAILNASNGKAGAGAVFTLGPALGTDQRLRPGEISGPVVMRFRVKDALTIPDMHLTVSGVRVMP